MAKKVVVVDTSKIKARAPKVISAETIKEWAESEQKRNEILNAGDYAHSEERHEGLTTQDLLKRLHDNKNLSCASVFSQPINKLVQKVLSIGAVQISDWYNNSKDQEKEVSLTLPYMVGHGITAGDRKDHDCRIATFILQKTKESPGFRIKTAYPDIEKSMTYDLAKAQTITANREKNGRFDRADLCVSLESEASAAKTTKDRFAVVASHFSHKDFESAEKDGVKIYYNQFSRKLGIKDADGKGLITMDENMRVSGELYNPKTGKFETVSAAKVIKMIPKLEPYMVEMLEEKNRLKQANLYNDIAETISDEEKEGKVTYLNTRHQVKGLLEIRNQAKVHIVMPGKEIASDGYILQYPKSKGAKTVFVDKWTGDRMPLDPAEFEKAYKVEPYDTQKTLEAKEREREDSIDNKNSECKIKEQEKSRPKQNGFDVER